MAYSKQHKLINIREGLFGKKHVKKFQIIYFLIALCIYALIHYVERTDWLPDKYRSFVTVLTLLIFIVPVYVFSRLQAKPQPNLSLNIYDNYLLFIDETQTERIDKQAIISIKAYSIKEKSSTIGKNIINGIKISVSPKNTIDFICSTQTLNDIQNELKEKNYPIETINLEQLDQSQKHFEDFKLFSKKIFIIALSILILLALVIMLLLRYVK